MPATRWGLTLPFVGLPLHDHLDLFRQAEAAGYDDLWTGETAGPDGFTPLALAAAVTERIRLATGIVNPYTRGPALLAQQAAALQDASNGRFVLGIGSSSNVIVERWNEIPFVKPLSKVREAIENLRPVFAGERGAGGFKLETPPAQPIPIVVAALRGKMLGLAAELGDGAFTNFLPLSGLPQVKEAFGRQDKELVCRFFCVPMPEEQGMGLAKHLFASYGTVPVYAEFFRWLGWAEQLDPMFEAWHGGDRKRALELVPEDLVREIFVFGEPAAMRERLQQFADGGITTLILTAITAPDDVPRFVDALAPSG
jgi:probable F420-dependent oxidoreductase